MRWYDVKYALEQLGAGNITEAQLAKTLRGVKLDAVTEDGKRLLPQCAWDGNVKAVQWLLAKGADVNRVDTQFGVHGPAIVYAVTGNCSKTSDKLAIIAALVAAGADLDRTLGVRRYKGEKGGFAGGTTLDYAAFEALRELRIAESKTYDADSRRHAKSMHASYLKVIPALIAAGAIVGKQTAARLKKLGIDGGPKQSGTSPKDAAKAKKKNGASAKGAALDKAWAKKARARLGRKAGGTRSAIYDVCETWMKHPDAVASGEWAKVVGEMIDRSRTFEDVAEEVYGERVSFEDDEGHLCQGWDNHVVLDLVLELLGSETAVRNKHWEKLVKRVFELREKYHASSAVDAEAFFEQPWVAKHPAAKALRAFEKRTR